MPASTTLAAARATLSSGSGLIRIWTRPTRKLRPAFFVTALMCEAIYNLRHVAARLFEVTLAEAASSTQTTEAHVNVHAHDAERDAVAGHGAVAVNLNDFVDGR